MEVFIRPAPRSWTVRLTRTFHATASLGGRVGTYEFALGVLFALGLAYSARILVLSWGLPLLDMHGFRQTQTALTVQWMARGRPLLAYETPVVGSPWTTPFEFPLFQWTALLVHKAGLDLDDAGRLVSWMFFIAGLPASAYTIRKWGGDRSLILIFGSLWLFSPLYAFWSRAFMIESCATFFGLAFLAALSAYLQGLLRQTSKMRLVFALALTTMTAMASALVKITTFFGFALAGCGLTLWTIWSCYKRRDARSLLMAGIASAGAVGISLTATLAWTRYADELKASAPIAALMTSSSLQSWNFGFRRILSFDTWTDIIFGRAILDTLGSRLPILATLCILILTPRSRRLTIIAMILYIAPFFIFTNLHIIHNYYQFANALFLIFAVSGAIWAFGAFGSKTGRPSAEVRRCLVIAALAALILIEISAFRTRFLPALQLSPAKEKTLLLAQWIRRTVAPTDVVFIFGRDWSAELAYYSGRRAVMFPPWSTHAVLAHSPNDVAGWTGGAALGALVDCSDEGSDLRPWAREVEAGRSRAWVGGCKVYK